MNERDREYFFSGIASDQLTSPHHRQEILVFLLPPMESYHPDMSHVSPDCFERVYQPSSDSFFFSDVVIQFIRDLFSQDHPPTFILEVGSGSGYVSTSIGMAFSDSALTPLLFCGDLNPSAAQTTSETLNRNCSEVFSDVSIGSFGSYYRSSSFDLILFNPPYVPSTNDEITSDNPLLWSYAGGSRGRVVIDSFLSTIRRILRPNGTLLMIAVSENRPQDILTLSSTQFGLEGDIIADKVSMGEHLYVLRFQVSREFGGPARLMELGLEYPKQRVLVVPKSEVEDEEEEEESDDDDDFFRIRLN